MTYVRSEELGRNSCLRSEYIHVEDIVEYFTSSSSYYSPLCTTMDLVTHISTSPTNSQRTFVERRRTKFLKRVRQGRRSLCEGGRDGPSTEA